MGKSATNNSVIPRSEVATIERSTPPEKIREHSEVKSAYEQVGYNPNRDTKSWYRDIYEFYQQNEC